MDGSRRVTGRDHPAVNHGAPRSKLGFSMIPERQPVSQAGVAKPRHSSRSVEKAISRQLTKGPQLSALRASGLQTLQNKQTISEDCSDDSRLHRKRLLAVAGYLGKEIQKTGNAAQETPMQRAQQMLVANGIDPASLSPAQLAALANTTPHAQQKSIAAYIAHMQSYHGKQIGP